MTIKNLTIENRCSELNFDDDNDNDDDGNTDNAAEFVSNMITVFVAIDLVKRLWKSELSLQLFGRLNFTSICKGQKT